jgi:hypothetical protein
MYDCKNVQAYNLDVQSKNSIELYKNSILALLNPYLQTAVDEYYSSINKPIRQYGLYDAKILELKNTEKGQFTFYITIELNSYTGAHNPPYGKETISLYFDAGSAKVIVYKHQEINNG